jgi:uracil-DNA glycosylase
MILNFEKTHKSWHTLLIKSLSVMDQDYLKQLENSSHWLPGKENVFNAFTLPFHKVKRILLGESPYPRKASAIGYAFWDGAVENIFIDNQVPFEALKLSKSVNKATSLRNFIKMLLSLSDPNSAKILTLSDLFQRLIKEGFLLLNASLVFEDKKSVKDHAKAWHPFMVSLLAQIYEKNANIELLLFGKIANLINPYLIQHQLNFKTVIAEHPYNLSFIKNPVILNYFKQFNLLDV